METPSNVAPAFDKPKVFCHSRYDGSAPFTNHLSVLSEMLGENFTLTSLVEADYFVSLDHDPKTLENVDKQGIPASRRILIVREPRQVHPYSHSRTARKTYSKIIYMGAVDSGGVPCFWPYDLPEEFQLNEPTSPRLDRVVAIAGWRVSFIRGSLYGIRARAFSEESVDLFGRDWNAPLLHKTKEIVANGLLALRFPNHAAFDSKQIRYRPRAYKGSAQSKISVLTTYKVSLVIENSLDYFSEKLFDALVAGTIPVYCGPNPNLLGLPNGLVIWCEPRLDSIRSGIRAALEINYVQWRTLLDDWLRSFDENSPMRSKLVWLDVIESLRAHIAQNGSKVA